MLLFSDAHQVSDSLHAVLAVQGPKETGIKQCQMEGYP